jgi:hypothetical protein
LQSSSCIEFRIQLHVPFPVLEARQARSSLLERQRRESDADKERERGRESSSKEEAIQEGFVVVVVVAAIESRRK